MRPVQFCDYSHCCTYCISGNEKTLYILWCVVGFVDSDVDSLAFRVPRSTKRRHIYSTSGFHWIHMRRRDIGFILYWAVLYVLIQHRAAVCRTAIERHSVCLSVCLCVCVCVCVTVLHRIIAGRPRACAMSDYIRPRHHGIYCRLLYTLPGLDENYILISVVSDVCKAWYDTVVSALWRRHHTTCYTLQCRLNTLHTAVASVWCLATFICATCQLIILACIVAYV